MNSLHDTIKIDLIRQGYLPNYPYHMISDIEMCKAFLDVDNHTGAFYDYYPLLDEQYEPEYTQIVTAINDQLMQCQDMFNDEVIFDDWVYSYMLNSVISVKSDGYDIQYLADMLNVTVDFGVFSKNLYGPILEISKEWMDKLPNPSQRPPTIFGEPHVIKYLRLLDVQVGEVMLSGY